MGLTVACARCHDHKYDPIPTSDYYSLHSVFRSVDDVEDYPLIKTVRKIDLEQLKDYEDKREKAIQAKADYANRLAEEAQKDFAKRPEAYLAAIYDLSIARSAPFKS